MSRDIPRMPISGQKHHPVFGEPIYIIRLSDYVV
jgi:hypothetical protein